MFGPAIQRVAGQQEDELQMKQAPSAPAQLEPESLPRRNDTGLPDGLKSGIESLSGISLDDVNIHYNSSRPAQLDALAFAQGSDIHVAPGQEQHLPHEAWHVVQQAERRVQPTMQMKDGVPANDDAGLEHEADVMGARAAVVGRLVVPSGLAQGRAERAEPRLSSSIVEREAGGAKPRSRLIPYGTADSGRGPGVMPSFEGTGRKPVAQFFWGNEEKKKQKELKKDREAQQKLLFSRRARVPRFEKTKPEAVGSVSANEVSTGNFETTNSRGTSPTYRGFLKKPIRQGNAVTPSIQNLGYQDNEGKIVGDPRMIARSVASSRLDQALGLNVLAQEDFAYDYGGTFIGGVSGGVPGHALMTNRGRFSPKLPQIQEHRAIDPSHPETQRTAANLQALDFITGQSDRHAGNIFHDPKTGRIKGIDNDQAFGDPARNPARYAHGMEVNRMPQLIDRATAESLLRFKPKQIAKLLGGSKKDPERLNSAETQAARGRFEQLQAAIRAAYESPGQEGGLKIRDTWNAETLEAGAGKDEKGYRSYLGRYQDEYSTARTKNGGGGWELEVSAETGLPLGAKGAKMYAGTLAEPRPTEKAQLGTLAKEAEGRKDRLRASGNLARLQERDAQRLQEDFRRVQPEKRDRAVDTFIERSRRLAPQEEQGDETAW